MGIGWFNCSCGRIFCGFSRGDTSSMCHTCHEEVYPDVIVPGQAASSRDREDSDKKSHYCNVCRGNMNCPVVAAAKKLSEDNMQLRNHRLHERY